MPPSVQGWARYSQSHPDLYLLPFPRTSYGGEGMGWDGGGVFGAGLRRRVDYSEGSGAQTSLSWPPLHSPVACKVRRPSVEGSCRRLPEHRSVGDCLMRVVSTGFCSECPSPRWVAFHGYEPHLPMLFTHRLGQWLRGARVCPHTGGPCNLLSRAHCCSEISYSLAWDREVPSFRVWPRGGTVGVLVVRGYVPAGGDLRALLLFSPQQRLAGGRSWKQKEASRSGMHHALTTSTTTTVLLHWRFTHALCSQTRPVFANTQTHIFNKLSVHLQSSQCFVLHVGTLIMLPWKCGVILSLVSDIEFAIYFTWISAPTASVNSDN